METVLPATGIVVDRLEVDVFSASESVTDPLPEPLVGDIVSHDTPLGPAVQLPPAQPDGAPLSVTACDAAL